MGKLPTPLQMLRREAIRARTKAFIAHQRYFGRVCFIHINKCGGTSVEKALGLPLIHDTALQRIEKVGRARWDQMACFALIRHPYAKAVSHYKYRRKTGQGSLDTDDINLDDWICEAYGARNPRYYNNPLMFQPCLDWVADRDGVLLVPHILKLEEIDTAWPTFCKEVLGQDRPLPHSNATSPEQVDPATRLSSEARSILTKHFAQDFARFDYSS